MGPGPEKHLNILDYALSSLWRRKGKNGSILLIFTAVLFLVASFQLVTRALTDVAAALLTGAPAITIQKMVAGRQESIPLAYSRALRGLYGIRQVTPRIWGYYFDEVRGANITVLGIDPGGMPGAGQLARGLAGGRLPAAGGEVAVGQGVRRLLGLALGRSFSFFRPDLSLQTFKVVGLFGAASDLLTGDTVLMPLAAARDLFRLPADRVTDLCVSVYNPAEIDTMARKIAERLPDARVVTRPQILKTYQVVFGWRSGFAAICLLASLAAFAVLSWDKASGLSPEERREIAILKVLGWETSDILEWRFWEGGVVAGAALLLGWSLAYIHVLFGNAALFRPMLLGWSVLRPSLRLVPHPRLADLLLVAALTVLPYLAVTVIPAWRAASVPPEKALGG